MSRSLDPDTATIIQADSSEQVYADIVKALSFSELLEIEILGKSHPMPPECNVLVDGNSIAFSKGKLVQAFVIARKIFFRCLKGTQDENQQEIRDATAVILLLDPEHLTAANARKRIIQKYQKKQVGRLEDILRLEMIWVNSMLTSRLHRHTKSPTLWGHRRWVLEICRSIEMPRDTQKDLSTVVLVAAERHPRNYYAWLHMRWLLQKSNPIGLDYSKLISTVLDWCLRHPYDTSGFSFLLFCLSHLPEGDQSRIDANIATCRDVLGLAVSFQWTHESVWVFLRTLIASGEVSEDQKNTFFSSIETLLGAQSENTKAQTILQSARDWCLENERAP